MSNSETGRLEAIWVKRARRVPLDRKDRARLIAGKGLEDDVNFGKKRQITLLSIEKWREVCRELGEDLDPAVRRANLLVTGLDLAETAGQILAIGPCRIRVQGETHTCGNIEKTHRGLSQALDPDWRGGVYGDVVDGGEIAVGDPVRWEPG